MNEEHNKAIELLATYLSGSNVAAASIGLQLGGHALTLAQPYFALREALGVRGYASREEALNILREAFATRTEDTPNPPCSLGESDA